jgi:hypothetical protein
MITQKIIISLVSDDLIKLVPTKTQVSGLNLAAASNISSQTEEL